ncbi:PREDICTED: uncharacterized protein LOC105557058 [Vollenhovia emeryi]|uniref:uncharacterized protein LOC105557058 n=1 Tax=Vollenhovia emeryi TaxID=411798 RepID=UPI0005F575EE|nr:PREDICTED: uncharacterized protein LOC105557058 [Vollenhovia emeryi]XP_011859581.1 PREDICTED: uncharacterized protein LOC105557058 [Vollenhovia emeryi]
MTRNVAVQCTCRTIETYNLNVSYEKQEKKRSRPRSRSRSRHKKSRNEEKLEKLQERLDNLTKVVETLVVVQGAQALPNADSRTEAVGTEDKENQSPSVAKTPDINEVQVVKEVINSDHTPEQATNNEALKVLGADPSDLKFKKISFHPELKNTWKKKGEC